MPSLLSMVDCKGPGTTPDGWYTGSFIMPERAKNTGIRIISIDAIYSSRDLDGLNVWVNEVERAQLITGKADNFIEQPNSRLVCELTDFSFNQIGQNFVLRSPGIYAQNIFRDEPFTGSDMTVVCSILAADPGIDSWDIKFGFKVVYDFVSISSGDEIRLSL